MVRAISAHTPRVIEFHFFYCAGRILASAVVHENNAMPTAGSMRKAARTETEAGREENDH